ncbi:MAG: FMN-binding negative transcriptional regulator [Sphingosinicella sp.]|nr:FMN-binding negative transcriptional regulator [Sphingosinicella sp.]
MYPFRYTNWTDRGAMLTFIDQVSFAHLFIQTPEGPMVAHAPLIVTAEGNLRFHLARANRLTAHLDGAQVLASIAGADAYVSPDWYGSDDQVPTWNYVAVEVTGIVRRVSGADLVQILDTLSAMHEARLVPKKPWTRGKMSAGLFDGMQKAICGFEMTVEDLKGTRKVGQNKSPAEIESAAAALDAAGKSEMAALMRSACV